MAQCKVSDKEMFNFLMTKYSFMTRSQKDLPQHVQYVGVMQLMDLHFTVNFYLQQKKNVFTIYSMLCYSLRCAYDLMSCTAFRRVQLLVCLMLKYKVIIVHLFQYITIYSHFLNFHFFFLLYTYLCKMTFLMGS